MLKPILVALALAALVSAGCHTTPPPNSLATHNSSKWEKEIAALEIKEKELTAELERPETYATGGRAMQVNRELLEVHDRLPQAISEWEAAAGELAAVG